MLSSLIGGVLVLAVYTANAAESQSGVQAFDQGTVEPPIPACISRPLPVDPAKVQQMATVEGVIADYSISMVTVLFKNGDVLRVKASPKQCRGPNLAFTASFWSYYPLDAHQKAMFVTDLMLPKTMAKEVDQDVTSAKDDWIGGSGLRFQGKTKSQISWNVSTHLTPTWSDGMGQLIEINYWFPSGVDEPLH